MDDIARGVATAALTLQSELLQALVVNGTITPAAALEVVDKALDASMGCGTSKEEKAVEAVTIGSLEGVRKGLAELVN